MSASGLPIIGREYFVNGYAQADAVKRRERTPGMLLPDGFVFQAGQPEDVRQAYRKAMGL